MSLVSVLVICLFNNVFCYFCQFRFTNESFISLFLDFEIKKNTKIENNQISHLEYDFLPSQKVKSIGRCFYVVS